MNTNLSLPMAILLGVVVGGTFVLMCILYNTSIIIELLKKLQ